MFVGEDTHMCEISRKHSLLERNHISAECLAKSLILCKLAV